MTGKKIEYKIICATHDGKQIRVLGGLSFPMVFSTKFGAKKQLKDILNYAKTRKNANNLGFHLYESVVTAKNKLIGAYRTYV